MTPKETLTGELRRQGTGIWGPNPKPRATHFYSAAALKLKKTERVTRNSNLMAPREMARQKTPYTPVNPPHPNLALKMFICLFGHQGAPQLPQNCQNWTRRPKPVKMTPRNPIRSQNWRFALFCHQGALACPQKCQNWTQRAKSVKPTPCNPIKSQKW